MRRTKNTTILLVVLAILALGIGYAAATAQLQINGTLGATAVNENFSVEFTEAVVQENEDFTTVEGVEQTLSASIDAQDSTLATFVVTGCTAKDDTVLFKYSVANQSPDLAAIVTATEKTEFGNSEYFTVNSYFWGDTDDVEDTTTFGEVDTVTIEPGMTNDLYVRVTCIKTPLEDVTAEETEGIIGLHAVPTEPKPEYPDAQ